MTKTRFKRMFCLLLALGCLCLCACGQKNAGQPSQSGLVKGVWVDNFPLANRDLVTRLSTPRTDPSWAQDEADLARFIDYMNQKAQALGMTNSHFEDAAGMHNISTARDLLRLTVCAKLNPTLDHIWTQPYHTVTISGGRELTKSYTSARHPSLDDYYQVVGHKGGSLNAPKYNLCIFNLTSVLKIPDSEDLLFVAVMYAEEDTDRRNNNRLATKQVADIAMALYHDPNADVSHMPVCCENAIAAVLPAGGASYEDLRILYERNADVPGRTMSVSKILTALCVLDYVPRLDATLTYRPLDVTIRYFNARDYAEGDQVSYEDAMYALLLGSSNLTAQALARQTGAIMSTK